MCLLSPVLDWTREEEEEHGGGWSGHGARKDFPGRRIPALAQTVGTDAGGGDSDPDRTSKGASFERNFKMAK